jgi:hypothetical protein
MNTIQLANCFPKRKNMMGRLLSVKYTGWNRIRCILSPHSFTILNIRNGKDGRGERGGMVGCVVHPNGFSQRRIHNNSPTNTIPYYCWVTYHVLLPLPSRLPIAMPCKTNILTTKPPPFFSLSLFLFLLCRGVQASISSGSMLRLHGCSTNCRVPM